MLKKIRVMVVMVFLSVLAFVSVGSLIAKDREFSPNENRYLEEKPKLSLDNIMSGKFQEDLENYLRDQVIGRDTWITVKTGVEKASGNTDIGGAYVGKDGYDFEKITPEDVDDTLFRRNVQTVSDFFTEASDAVEPERLSFLLVPTSGLVMENKLPKNARLFDQAKYIDEVQQAMENYDFIDVRQELTAHKDDYIYYRTDHHWTTDGAYIAYEKWCESTGEACPDKSELEQKVVTDRFRGSLYSKILDVDSAYDSIVTYGSKDKGAFGSFDCTITIDGKETRNSCFDEAKLAEKDKYAYFFGGNYGEVHIENTGRKDAEEPQKNLLVIKDSFANSFVPFLTQDFDNIYMIDLRYYNDNMQEYLKGHNITDVLVLYNISNFVSDRNIYKLTDGV